MIIMLPQKPILCITSRLLFSDIRTHGRIKFLNIKYGSIVRPFSDYYTEKQIVERIKKPKDARIVALRDKLLYCDYLDYDIVKFGFKKCMAIKQDLKKEEREKETEKLIHEPVYSVILNQMLSEEKQETIIDAECLNFERHEVKPIHMPYASTDDYETVEIASDDSSTKDTQSLNPLFKELYEKYLEMKKTDGENSDMDLEEYVMKNSDLETQKSFSNIPKNWMTDYEEFDDTLQETLPDNIYGTADPNTKVSSVPCGGCGALLHCKDVALPGYLPSELFLNKTKEDLKLMVCQRCHFMKYYNTALEVKVSTEDYPKLLSVIKKTKCAVILMIDLTDFPCSIWSDVKSILHPATVIFAVGNKVDLLPPDFNKFEPHVKECIAQYLESIGIKQERIKHIALTSAKTGYGIEELINKLHKLWEYKGDVYLIGCTNVGKSSLFNALLQSDYCKVQAVDLIQRATTSQWPGTTLNLLKFPILNPQKYRLYLRTQRLKAEAKDKATEKYLRAAKFRESRNIQYATLQGRIGKTFGANVTEETDPFSEQSHLKNSRRFGLDETSREYKYGRWCYDTPGAIQADQILDLLTTDELFLTLPQITISPRTFILSPAQTLFLAGMGRMDYLEGNGMIRCTVFASHKLPVTICHTCDADYIYGELLTTEAFVVPKNDPERLKLWPALSSKEMEVTGITHKISAADVVLSSAGWISLTPREGEHIRLKAWTPQGRGLHLRVPALLQHSVALRGRRVQQLPVYRKGRQAYVK